MHSSRALLWLALLFFAATLSGRRPNDGEGLALNRVADISLPGPAVRFDYQSLDSASGRLYIAHMNANQLTIYDVRQRKVIANVDGFPSVHGVLAVPELGRVYASVTGEHKLAVVDATTLKIIAKVGPIDYPDGIAYAPKQRRVFVSDEQGDADAVIDAQSNTLLKKVALGGGAGNTVFDSGSGRILVAVHETNELAVIDPTSAEVVERHKLKGIREPHGIALDADNRLAFVAGAANSALALVDLDTFAVLATYPVGRDPDFLAFDSSLRQLYVATESGQIWVYREKGRRLVHQGHFSMPHAHTVCVDSRTHLVYFPLENVNGRAILRIMEVPPSGSAVH